MPRQAALPRIGDVEQLLDILEEIERRSGFENLSNTEVGADQDNPYSALSWTTEGNAILDDSTDGLVPPPGRHHNHGNCFYL